MSMPRPSNERVFREIAATIQRHKLQRAWHSTGKLVKALIEDKHDDIAAVICEVMSADATAKWTNSVFIQPMLEHLHEVLSSHDYVHAHRGTGGAEGAGTKGVRPKLRQSNGASRHVRTRKK